MKNKVQFIERIIEKPVYQISYDVNFRQLYKGCPKGKWSGRVERNKKDRFFSKKIDRIFKNRYEYKYKSKGVALKVAEKLAKLKEIKKVRVFEV